MSNLELTSRKIYFYELKIEYLDEFQPNDNDQFREFFSIITRLASKKDPTRYQIIGDKILFIQDIKFVPNEKKIKGKLRCIRKDILPEIINMENDKTKGIHVEDEEGIVETSHFVIDYARKTKIVALEYNQFGARVNDFIFYCNNIGTNCKMTSSFDAIIITKDNLAKVKEKINACSELTIRVQNSNLGEIENFDKQVFSLLNDCSKYFETKYSEIRLNFDYKNTPDPKANNFVNSILDKFISDSSSKDMFEHFSIKAQDSSHNNRLEVFDLLIDKAKVEIKVQKKANYRSIISSDILEKMTSEVTKFRL